MIDSKRHVEDNVIENDLCSHSEDDLCSQKSENYESFDSAVSIDSIEDVSSISQSELSVEADISDDKTLVEAARNGDSLAITLLVIKYHGFLDKYVGLLNIPVRYKEDYIQEGLIGLLKAVRTFDVEKGFSFSTYAWRCIKNSIISEIRRNERCGLKNEVSVDELQDGILEEFSGVFVTSPEDEYIDKESSSQLHDTIFSVLSTYESQVFGMYLAEIPYSQIASRLGKDVKSIDNAIQRIKNKLKKLV